VSFDATIAMLIEIAIYIQVNYRRLSVYLLVLSQVSVVAVRTCDDLLRAVFVQMFLQKSLLEFGSTVVLAKDFSVLAVRVHMLLKHTYNKHDFTLNIIPLKTFKG